jgi:hypothetical protein
LSEIIPLLISYHVPDGTRENYERPIWTFNKLVVIEKEGWTEALKDVGWPKQHDCSVISSEGFTTSAIKDLADKLAEHDEPVTVFCAHDADAAGPLIYQTFQEETKARGARKIRVVNLGLEPWEAIEMGLEIEDIERGKRRRAVADYVRERTDIDDYLPDCEDENWEEWLQTHRIELNAMKTLQLIEWLNAKLAPYEGERAPYDGKLIPPDDILKAELDDRIEDKIRAAVAERILREAGFEDQVADAIAEIKTPSADALVKGIKKMFKSKLDREWRDHIEVVATELVEE